MPGLSESRLLHHGGRSGSWGSLGWWGAPMDAPMDALNEAPDYALDYAPIDYHGACTALARHLAHAAGLGAGDRVLSVACGEGEELRLWVQEFGAGAVVGVELDAGRAQRARAATAALPGVRVLHGSGAALPALGLPEAGFDRVLCVDAAYHLQPRTAFLQAAFKLLRPGGRLAYTDLMLHSARAVWRRALLGLGTRACGLAPGSLLSAPAQLQRLYEAGFGDAQLQVWDDAVLGGYTRFVRRQARTLPGGVGGVGGVWQAGWRRVALTAMWIPPCRAAGLGYAMLSARKPLGMGMGMGTAAGAAATAAATASADRTALSSSGTPSSA